MQGSLLGRTIASVVRDMAWAFAYAIPGTCETIGFLRPSSIRNRISLVIEVLMIQRRPYAALCVLLAIILLVPAATGLAHQTAWRLSSSLVVSIITAGFIFGLSTMVLAWALPLILRLNGDRNQAGSSRLILLRKCIKCHYDLEHIKCRHEACLCPECGSSITLKI